MGNEFTDYNGRPVIVAFGDSLTAGVGVDPAFNYPSRLQVKIDEAGYRYRVVNAGISGETTARGLDRVQTMREFDPEIAIVELGANDGLRQLPIDEMGRNLSGIVREFKQMGAAVIIAGMEIPPGNDPRYAESFRETFRNIAAEHRIPLIPFFLEGVGGRPRFNQEDGIHPNADGYAIIVENIWPVLEPCLARCT
ncbi:MAG TPA: arylesterase [Acidobacteriota bacterium]|nr:arylesterase [Acidobacteriota bacterium]